MQDTPHEPWIADIALELEKIRRTLEEGVLLLADWSRMTRTEERLLREEDD